MNDATGVRAVEQPSLDPREAPQDDSSRARADGHPAEAADGSAAPSTAVERHEGFAAAHGAEQNRLLRALPLDEYARLLPLLTPVRLGLKEVLVEPDAPIRDVYFPREGVASVLAEEQEGGPVEVGTIGQEGFVGLPVLLGADRTPFRVFVQIEGHGWRLSADALRRLVAERAAVRVLLLRYAQYYTDQVSQAVACNRLHTLDERCARWLLMTHDRVEGRTFEMTHQFLGLMLGVRRAGVTVAMGSLQAEGIVRYARGRVTILDRQRLEEESCGCYHVTRAALCRLLG
jgi:CRP-like cAMP-binding protein